jgi:hypothetical protein
VRQAKLELSPLLCKRFGLTANVRPLDREVQYRTRLFARLKQSQRGEHHAALQITVKGRAKVMTHRPGKKQCTRNFDCLGDVARYSDGNRWHTARFNGSLDQSDGLMTDWSSGRQQRTIGALLLHDRFGNSGSNGSLKLLGIHVVADKTEEIRSQPA